MGTIAIGIKLSYPKKYIGWRCLHWREGGLDNPIGMPCVRPSVNAPPIVFTGEMQIKSYKLNLTNPLFTGEKWRVVYAETTAFTNENGFDGDTIYRDYVNSRNLEAVFYDGTPALPKLMKAIICGGMFIRGEVEGENLVCTPGIHGIDTNKPIPDVETILKNNWYFYATTGGWNKVSHFPQGGGNPVLIPYCLKQKVSYPLKWFTRWEDNTLPDPIRFYNPL